MDRLTALKVFRKTGESGSFAEAARQLGLSPAAISKNIGELEAHLKVRLFNRTTRRMSLTEAGTIYLDRICRILDNLEEADRALDPLHETPSGTLRVAAPMTATLMCLSRAIPRFLAQYPAISLDLDLDDRRVDIVRDGYDLAIRGSDNLENSSLTARKLVVMPHVLCAAPSYIAAFGEPTTPEALRSHHCIRFSLSGHANAWEFREGERTVRVAAKGRYSVTSSLAVRDALLEGLGIGLIPAPYVREEIATGRLRPMLENWSTSDVSIYAVYPSRQHLAPKLRAFLDFLIVEMKASCCA